VSDLMKKVFNDKRYQFGYNDAMQIAFDNVRELKATIERITYDAAEDAQVAKEDIADLKATVTELTADWNTERTVFVKRITELESTFDKAMEMLYEAYAGTVRMKEVDAIKAALKQEYEDDE